MVSTTEPRSPGLPRAVAPEVVVTVATYNGRHLLRTFLPALASQCFRDFRVVVVDDGSSDGTVRWLECAWPEVEVVALSVNGGVTRAFNEGVRAAWDAEFIAMFNNDVELEPDCLALLVDELRAHPKAAAVGGKLLNYYRRGEIDGAGDVFDWAGTATRRGHGEINVGQYEVAQSIFGVCAGAGLYRRSAFETVGLFDERFFAYFEDVDWCFRAQLAGLSCRYVPKAVGYHMGSETFGRGLNDFTRYQLIRNSIWIVAKNYPAAALIRHAPRIIYVQTAQFVLAVRHRKLVVWGRAVRDALRSLPAVARDRRVVQATRTAPLGELERVVASR